MLIELRQLFEVIELALEATRFGLGESFGTALRLPPEWGARALLPRRPRVTSSSIGGGVDIGGASRLMMSEVTLLAVTDMPVLTSTEDEDLNETGGGSATGDNCPVCAARFAEPPALPKLSFHLDGFFVTGNDVVDVEAWA